MNRYHIISNVIKLILKQSNFKIIAHHFFLNSKATIIFEDENGDVYVNQTWKVKSQVEVRAVDNRVEKYF